MPHSSLGLSTTLNSAMKTFLLTRMPNLHIVLHHLPPLPLTLVPHRMQWLLYLLHLLPTPLTWPTSDAVATGGEWIPERAHGVPRTPARTVGGSGQCPHQPHRPGHPQVASTVQRGVRCPLQSIISRNLQVPVVLTVFTGLPTHSTQASTEKVDITVGLLGERDARLVLLRDGRYDF